MNTYSIGDLTDMLAKLTQHSVGANTERNHYGLPLLGFYICPHCKEVTESEGHCYEVAVVTRTDSTVPQR